MIEWVLHVMVVVHLSTGAPVYLEGMVRGNPVHKTLADCIEHGYPYAAEWGVDREEQETVAVCDPKYPKGYVVPPIAPALPDQVEIKR